MTASEDRFCLHTEQEMLEMPRRKWLVDGVIREGTISLLVGQPGSHKSFVALSLAESVGRGEPWAGFATTQKPVVYVLGERAGFQPERIEAIVREKGYPSQMVHYLKHPVQFDRDGERKKFIDMMTSKGVDGALVIIDTLRNCFSGNENDSHDANNFMLSLRELQDEVGVDILLVHHSARTQMENARGSTAFVGSADHELYVRTNRKKKPHEVTVQARKTNHGKAWLKLTAVPRAVDVSGGLTSVVLDYNDVVELDEFDDGGENEGADVWPDAILRVLEEARPAGENLTKNGINERASGLLRASKLSGTSIQKKLDAMVVAGLVEPFQVGQGTRVYYRSVAVNSLTPLAT